MKKILIIFLFLSLHGCFENNNVNTAGEPDYTGAREAEVVKLIASKYDLKVFTVRSVIEGYYQNNNLRELKHIYLPENQMANIVKDYKILTKSYCISRENPT